MFFLPSCLIYSVILVRFNGPNKMNTISAGMQEEAKIIFTSKILPNKGIVVGVVYVVVVNFYYMFVFV